MPKAVKLEQVVITMLRFMSPFMARVKRLDRFPPGEQPQMRMARASMLVR